MTLQDVTFIGEMIHGLNPQYRPAARVRGGHIEWRGSTDHFSRLLPDEAYRLRGLFAMDPSSYAGRFVNDLDAAISEYEALNV